jgi:hypothetical protein
MPHQGSNSHAGRSQRKRCRVCRQAKSLSDFYRLPHAGGPRSACKSCCRAESRCSRVRRQRAIARLIANHRDEYRQLLKAEREIRRDGAHGGAHGGEAA